jgi:hypothetical protein
MSNQIEVHLEAHIGAPVMIRMRLDEVDLAMTIPQPMANHVDGVLGLLEHAPDAMLAAFQKAFGDDPEALALAMHNDNITRITEDQEDPG